MMQIITDLLGSISYDSMDELMVQLLTFCVAGWILFFLFSQVINLFYYIFKLILK